MAEFTEKELEVLRALAPWKRDPEPRWHVPMDMGSWDGSHHSNTARRLAERGLVEMRRRGIGEPYTQEQVLAMKGRFKRRNEKRPAYQRTKGSRGAPKEYRISQAGIDALAAHNAALEVMGKD